MPISRTHYNALVDDDGSNTTGTLWNKAKVGEVLDDIDSYVGPFGTWTAVTYAGGNFTGNGSMTWTVDSGDQLRLAYRRFEKTIAVVFALTTTSVGGTPSSDLQIAIPLGLTSANRSQGWLYYLDNGTHGSGLASTLASGTKIILAKSGFGNWSASTNLTSAYGYIEIETTT